jgi:hypothetical protein
VQQGNAEHKTQADGDQRERVLIHRNLKKRRRWIEGVGHRRRQASRVKRQWGARDSPRYYTGTKKSGRATDAG